MILPKLSYAARALALLLISQIFINQVQGQAEDQVNYLAYFYTDIGAKDPENERIILNEGTLYAEKTGYMASKTKHPVSADSLNAILDQAMEIAFTKYPGGRHNQVGECFSKGTYKIRISTTGGKRFELEWDLCKVPKHWEEVEFLLDRMKRWVEWR